MSLADNYRSHQPKPPIVERNLVATLSKLAKTCESPEEFFRNWLLAVLSTTTSHAGAITRPVEDRFDPIAIEDLRSQDSVMSCVLPALDGARRLTLSQSRARWVRRNDDSVRADESPEGDELLLMVPIGAPGSWFGVVEIGLPIESPTTQLQECATLITSLNAFVDEFLVRDQLRRLTADVRHSSRNLEFIEAIQRATDPRTLSFAIVNESRRLIGCERITLLIRKRGRFQVIAISDSACFDARSPTVKSLAALTNVVADTGMPLCYEASKTGPFPPQIEAELTRFIDLTHAEHLRVVPLSTQPRSDTPELASRSFEPIGMLVLEYHRSTEAFQADRDRAELVVRHAGLALAAVAEQQKIVLLPLWRTLGAAQGGIHKSLGSWRGRISCAALVVALVLLCMIDTPFSVHSSGVFQPIALRDVFAPQNGTISELRVRHGEEVEIGTPLLTIRNSELDLSLNEARGRLSVLTEELAAVERTLLGSQHGIRDEERVRLSGRRAELTHERRFVSQRLGLLEARRASLTVVSPIKGDITTWDLDRLLKDRPVSQGQSLLSIGDLSGDWQLELYVPERFLGHVARARKTNDELIVRFRLSSDPTREYVGVVKEIDRSAELRDGHGNSIRVTVAIDAVAIPHLKPGVSATAKIDCGRRSLVYVWTHDFIDFVRTKVLFRLS